MNRIRQAAYVVTASSVVAALVTVVGAGVKFY
jgi:hypothetical protein